jgi:hypothetical protein
MEFTESKILEYLEELKQQAIVNLMESKEQERLHNEYILLCNEIESKINKLDSDNRRIYMDIFNKIRLYDTFNAKQKILVLETLKNII